MRLGQALFEGLMNERDNTLSTHADYETFSTHVNDRFSLLERSPANWSGHGPTDVVSTEVLRNAKAILRALLLQGAPSEPAVFGHPEGGVTFRWDNVVIDVLADRVVCLRVSEEEEVTFPVEENPEFIKFVINATKIV
jgi:hypothetical protein